MRQSEEKSFSTFSAVVQLLHIIFAVSQVWIPKPNTDSIHSSFLNSLLLDKDSY